MVKEKKVSFEDRLDAVVINSNNKVIGKCITKLKNGTEVKCFEKPPYSRHKAESVEGKISRDKRFLFRDTRLLFRMEADNYLCREFYYPK